MSARVHVGNAALAGHQSKERGVAAVRAALSQLKLNHFHDLHSVHLSQKQLSLEGSQPLRADIPRGSQMIHEMTHRDTVRNEISQGKKKIREPNRERETSKGLIRFLCCGSYIWCYF